MSLHPMPERDQLRERLEHTSKNQAKREQKGRKHGSCRRVRCLSNKNGWINQSTNEQMSCEKVLINSSQAIKKSHWNAARSAGTVTSFQKPDGQLMIRKGGSYLLENTIQRRIGFPSKDSKGFQQ